MSVSLPPDYPLVKADFSLMEQVLVNLLLNACVHTPEGTSVTLQGGTDSARGQVWLDIHDMGPGIPPERAETIFERFRTTRPGGFGPGAPHCARVHGSSARCRLAGSRFRRNMFPACPSPGGAR